MILYSYRCEPCMNDFDEFAPLDKYDRAAPCPMCGGFAPRRRTFPTIDPRLGLDRDAFPTMASKWEKKQRQRGIIEKNREIEHGQLDVNDVHS